uniref:Uncharacterized protein n=1 Tax=Vespula pensylvanica TaxID=30213 RepID=A0A834UB03_VESPE|nr:hypothetical protein H0235_006929 [Vespula pensylvanica]
MALESEGGARVVSKRVARKEKLRNSLVISRAAIVAGHSSGRLVYCFTMESSEPPTILATEHSWVKDQKDLIKLLLQDAFTGVTLTVTGVSRKRISQRVELLFEEFGLNPREMYSESEMGIYR